MKILILGAGIAGVTAAYTLGSRGYSVEVLERESGAAMATSFANGGQLSYSHAAPWANPSVLPKVFKWMFRDDAPLVFRPRADFDMMRWGISFLLNCTNTRARKHTEVMLRLGLYSRRKLEVMRKATGIEFNFLQKGILHIFSKEQSLAEAIDQANFQETLGCKQDILTREQCLAKEPALQGAKLPIVGGLFSDTDETGDIHVFTEKLAEYCRDQFGAVFHYNTSIRRLHSDGERITGVETDKGNYTADAYVLALGPWGRPLANAVGVTVPMYPMKGYSITVPAWENAPQVSVTDGEHKVVFSRLGNYIRAAGTAEFAGYNTEIREVRITPIVKCMQLLFPAARVEAMAKWACIRPQTSGGPPLIGATKLKNFFLHTGHGTLGWTQSPGSAHLLADIIEGRETEIPMTGLGMTM